MVRCVVEDMLYIKDLIHRNKNSCIRHSLMSLILLIADISIVEYNSFIYKDYLLLLLTLLFILNVGISVRAFRRFKFYEREDATYELYQRCPNKVEVAWYDLK